MPKAFKNKGGHPSKHAFEKHNGTDTADTLDASDLLKAARMNAGDGDDMVIGSAFGDRINAGDGDDTVEGGAGNDSIFGNDGTDAVLYSGSILDFSWSMEEGNRLVVTDLNTDDGDEGRDTLKHIETLIFDDFTFDLTANNGPLIQADDQTTDEDSAILFGFDAFDFDSAGFTIDAVTVTGGGTVGLTGPATALSPGMGTGARYEVSFDPGDAYQSLGVGETATETLTITATDSDGATTTLSRVITIEGVNDAPTAQDGSGTVSEDGTLTATGNLDAQDVDANDTLSYTVIGGGTGTFGTLSVDANGTWTYVLNNGADAVQDLNTGDTETDSFLIEIADGNGGTTTSTVEITVNGEDDATVTGTTYTFDDVPGFENPSDNDLGLMGDGYAEMNWDNAAILDGPEYFTQDSGYIRGRTSGDFVMFNGGGLEMTMSDENGDEFIFVSINMTAAWNEGLNVDINGYVDGLLVETDTVVIGDDAPTTFTFNWEVDEVSFVSYGGTDAGTPGIGPHVAFDDLVIA